MELSYLVEPIPILEIQQLTLEHCNWVTLLLLVLQV